MPDSDSQIGVDSDGLQAHYALVNRMVARAGVEGYPLSSLELQQFDSDHMSKEEYQRFSDEFERQFDWQGFLDRTSGILQRAIAEDAQKDPLAPNRYNEMVRKLEGRKESFTLWACCVPAISGYKSAPSNQWLPFVVVLGIVLAIMLFALKII